MYPLISAGISSEVKFDELFILFGDFNSYEFKLKFEVRNCFQISLFPENDVPLLAVDRINLLFGWKLIEATGARDGNY